MQVGFNCQQPAQMGPMEEERGGPANCMVSLLRASGVEADAVVGVGDGTDDAPVPLTGQAPLTGTPVVDAIEGLQRQGQQSHLVILCSLLGWEMAAWYFPECS